MPEDGLIFGGHPYREVLKRAAVSAGLEDDRAHHVSNHDFRHAALTRLASRSNNLAGGAYLAGHKQVTTTARYVHGAERHVRQVLLSLTAEPRRSTAPRNDKTPRPGDRSGARRNCPR